MFRYGLFILSAFHFLGFDPIFTTKVLQNAVETSGPKFKNVLYSTRGRQLREKGYGIWDLAFLGLFGFFFGFLGIFGDFV